MKTALLTICWLCALAILLVTVQVFRYDLHTVTHPGTETTQIIRLDRLTGQTSVAAANLWGNTTHWEIISPPYVPTDYSEPPDATNKNKGVTWLPDNPTNK